MRIEGHYVYKEGARFAVVVARTNSLVTQRLVSGCMDAFMRHGVPEEAVDVVWVPGAFELPVAVKAVCDKQKHAAVVAVGCVLRGGTPHFDYIAAEATRGIGELSLNSKIPVAFGLLTCDNLEQALNRAGAKSGNKGWEAAMSALEMADLLGKL